MFGGSGVFIVVVLLPVLVLGGVCGLAGMSGVRKMGVDCDCWFCLGR